MPNKKLLIVLGVSLLMLLSAIIYREVREEEVSPEDVPTEEVSDGVEIDTEEEGEIEEIISLFNSVEEKFFSLVEGVVLLGDEETERLEEDLLLIEEKINDAKEELDKEDIDTERAHEYLSEVQEMIGELSEKLVEIEEE